MHIAVLADIHSNLAALQAVLYDIQGKGEVDEIWCLGDIVGYGPEPAECIKLIQKVKAVCIVGNHDLGAAGKMELSYFNPAAAQACEWTNRVLNPIDIRFLQDLPRTLKKGDFTLVHGSPMEPVMEYILSTSIAEKNFTYYDTQYCLVGHTHVPMAFKKEKEKTSSVPLAMGIGLVMVGHRIIINPGAVGQPRDGDPRASYGIYDSEGQMFRLFRVEYDVRATQDKMMRAGLPITLVTRLEQGK